MAENFSKILVCCDGSKYSEKAIRQACILAEKFSSKLTLIYVVDKTRKTDILAGNEYAEILRKYAKETLHRAQKIVQEYGLEPKLVTKEGNVANEIVRFSKDDNSDIIVVGSKGLGAVLQFLLGSVSLKVANHSLCSVLIVK